MANTTVNLIREPVGAEGKTIYVAVGASAIKEGIMVAQLDADAKLVPGSGFEPFHSELGCGRQLTSLTIPSTISSTYVKSRFILP